MNFPALFIGLSAWFAVFSLLSSAQADMTYPPGTVVVDVTQAPYNADPSGIADATAAIQLAIHRASQDGIAGDGIADDGVDDGFQDGISRSRPRILYFPAGIYRITDSLVGPALDDAQAGGLIILHGQSRTGSILRLDPNATGFDNPAAPKPVFTNFTGNSTNNAFMNGVENLTIEVGEGNPGTIALQFGDNNCGYVRAVTLRSLDPARTGVAGLDLSPGTSPTNPSGIGLIQDVSVEGFSVGIRTTRGLQMPWVLDRITLTDQTSAGILNANRPLTIRSLHSTNTVPAVRTTGPSAHVVLLDSTLVGGAPGTSAVDHQAGHLFLRNVSSSGYAQTLSYQGAPNGGDYSTSEFVSGPVLKLWETTPSVSLNLPIEDAPIIPWDAPADWVVVPAPTNDPAIDRPALQAAFNSGKSSIVLSPGTYAVDGTLAIGPNVRRILGNWSTIRISSSFKIQGQPVFDFGTSNHPAVVIEKLQAAWNDGSSYMIRHNSSADLILRDIFWVAGPVYRNVAGAGGRLFLENIHSLGGGQTPRENRPAFVFDHQDVWARQINPEMQHPHMINDGGKLVILGFKTGEQRGPVVITQNGGFTEILGGLQNMTHDNAPSDPEATTLLEIDNANVSAVFLERFEGLSSAWGNNAFVATETRGSETRTLRPQTVYRSTGNITYSSPVPQRAGQLGSVIPLFVGYQSGASISALVTHLTESAGATPVFRVSRDSSNTSQAQTIHYTVSGTATSGVDFAPLLGSLTIPIGASSAEIRVDPIAHPDVRAARTLTITLSSDPAYALGSNTSATLQIVTAGLIAPDGIDLSLPLFTIEQQTVTLFNPEAVPVTYTVTGINPVYSVSHRDFAPGDLLELGPQKTEVFIAKPADDKIATVNLPFDFPFYGTDYPAIQLNTNGYLTFDTSVTFSSWQNKDLPSSGQSSANPATIAYYWDDLYFDDASRFYYQGMDTNADGIIDVFVLDIQEATTFATRSNSIPQRMSAQVRLFRNGEIRVTFISSTITDPSYTIGIQNWEKDQGIRLVHNQLDPFSIPDSDLPPPYRAQAGTTVIFHPPVAWVTLPGTPVTVPANGQLSFDLTFATTTMALGESLSADILFAAEGVIHSLPVSLSALDLSTIPDPASGLTATAASDRARIVLTWEDHSDNETGFLVQRSSEGGNFLTIANVPINAVGYTDDGLALGTTYSYRIVAVNASGDAPASNTATATTVLTETLLTTATATWRRGNTNRSPSSTTAMTGSALELTAGGSNIGTDAQTPFWVYFPSVTLADGEALRFSTGIQFSGTLPNIGQGFSLGLVHSNGNQTTENVGGNNPPERRDDGGYGFTFGLGGSTTTRYIWKPAANAANGPWGNIDNNNNTLVLGASPNSYGINDTQTRTFLFELIRNGDTLTLRSTIDGVLYDGGRIVADPETFTFDSAAIVLRREGTQVSLDQLRVERERTLTPAEQWRFTHFGSLSLLGDAAWVSDPDHDGIPNLMEYALGGDPNVPHSAPQAELGFMDVDNETYLTFSIQRNPDATDIVFEVQSTTDLTLGTWPGGVIVVEDSPNLLKVRLPTPLSAETIRFLRLAIQMQP